MVDTVCIYVFKLTDSAQMQMSGDGNSFECRILDTGVGELGVIVIRAQWALSGRRKEIGCGEECL